MIIAFSGIDGSGKTTCAEFVSNYFKNKGIPIKYLHIVRDSFYHKILHSLIARVSTGARISLEKNLRAKENGPKFFILKLIKKAALFINLIYFNLRYWRYKNNIKRSIVTDRYFYDDIAQGIYLGVAGRAFINAFKKRIIQPDIVFYLRAEPSLAYARKQEYDEEYFLTKSGIYDEIYKETPNIKISEGSMESIKITIRNYLEDTLGRYV